MIHSKQIKLPAILVLIIVFLSLTGCQGQKSETQSSEIISLKIFPEKLPGISKLSNLIKEVRLVPLEYSSKCLIGRAGIIVFGDRNILVSSLKPEPTLFRFDIKGKFLNQIGSYGEGPGEFRDIGEIDLDEEANTVLIGSRNGSGMMRYSLDGAHIENIDLPSDIKSVKYLGNKCFVGRTWGDYEIAVYAKESDNTKYYIPTAREFQTQLVGFSGDYHNKVFYTSLGRDTIWEITCDTVKPFVVCDFGSGHFALNEYMSSIMTGYPKGRLSIAPGNVLWSAEYLHFRLLREDFEEKYQYFHIVVDLKSSSTWHLSQGIASDDILFCTSTDFRTITDSGEWVSVVGAYELIDALPLIKENTNFIYPENLISQIESMTENDNPVLVVYRLK